MPHAALKLVGGANVAETPAQNENGGIAQTNLIRYVYDPGGLTLVAKLGGWTAYGGVTTAETVAALWGWEDINSTAHLAYGVEAGGSNAASINVLTNGVSANVTPYIQTVTGPVSTIILLATDGSSTVKIGGNFFAPLLTTCVSVTFFTPLIIGNSGLVLSGSYAVFDADTPSFGNAVTAVDILGNPVYSSATTGFINPTLPTFTTQVTYNTYQVSVSFPGNTYNVGDTFAVLLPTTVGGITLFGNYIIQTAGSTFTINAATAALSAQTVTYNNGNIRCAFVYPGNGTLPTSPAATQSYFTLALDWTIDNFGTDMVACPTQRGTAVLPQYQPIIIWSPGDITGTIIATAPIVNDGIFVAMPQRQIIAWGSTETGIQDPLLISWCDVNNPYQWIPLVTNQAGNYRIPKGSKIVGCIQGPTQGLVWTDIAAWSMQYIGPPLVYSFNEIGTGCGLIARHAAASANGIVWWMGPSQFFTLSSNGVQPLPCPVWDVVFQNLNQSQLSNIRVGVNSLFNEISWFFTAASTGASQNDSFVKYNYLLNLWDYGIGSLNRSAWIDQSVLGPPIGADPVSFQLYQHETSNDAGGAAMNSYFQTGYYAINETDVKSFVDWIKPDAKWSTYTQSPLASLQITFFVADYAGQVPTVYGPYTVTQATEYFYTRFRARLMAIRVGSDDLGSYWRIGMLRYRFAPDGKI